MSVDLTKGATVELVKTLSDDLRTKDDNTKYSSAGAAMRDKANINGYYEDLVAGGSEQLLSSVYEEDSEPYLFRTSGGSIDIGDREEDTIVGGTVAWNQNVDAVPSSSEVYGITRTRTDDAKGLRYTGTSTNSTNFTAFSHQSSKYNIGHIYLYDLGVDLPTGCAISVRQSIDKCRSAIVNANNSTRGFGVVIANGTTVDFTAYPQSFDLTQIFGSAIAEYIYNLDTANPGTGVAWFKKLFPKPYYEYDEGSLKSVEGLTSHDTVGFNACGSALEFGNIDATGQNAGVNDTYIRTADYIRVVPNNAYCFYASTSQQFMQLYILQYDADKNVISRDALIAGSIIKTTKKVVYTISANTHYVRMFIYKTQSFATVSDVNFCINLSWDGERDGEYEPYVKHSYPLDDSLILRGVPKLDANNNLYYDGDVYEADGTVTRKYGIVDLGTLNWNADSNRPGVFYTGTNSTSRKYSGGIISAKYSWRNNPVPSEGSLSANDKQISMYPSYGSAYIYIIDTAYATTSGADFKTAINGVYAVCELATPTTEEAQPYQTPQIVDDFGTEEYVTDSIVPVGHVTKYMPNLKAKLEMAPDSPSDNGDYIVRHANGKNEYVPLVIPTELPTMPSEDGTYHLKVTVSNGTATLSWESES